MESREKRKVEKPRLPRTAKKIETKKMERQLGQLGLEIVPDEDVSIFSELFCFCVYVLVRGVTLFQKVEVPILGGI